MNRLVLFCLLGLLAACGSGSRESGIVTHVLADGRPRPLPLDSLFSAYRFVHPATSDSTLLSPDCFIRLGSDEVWVYSNKTFYRFGMDGILRGSFSRQGPGPQEYADVRECKISDRGEVWVVGEPNKLLVYDTEGRLLRKCHVPPYVRHLALADDFAVVQGYRIRAYPYVLTTLDRETLEVIAGLRPGEPQEANFYQTNWLSPSLLRRSDGIYHLEIAERDLYRVERDTLYPECRIEMEGRPYNPGYWQLPVTSFYPYGSDYSDYSVYYGLLGLQRGERCWLADVLGYGRVLYDPVTDRTLRIGSITLEAGSERLEVEPGWLEMLDDGMMCISISAVYLADRPALTEWMGIGAVREEDNDIYCIGKLR